MVSSRSGQDVPIKRNQFWKHNVAGYVMQVLRKDADTSWKCMKVKTGGGLHKVHKIREHDLYKKFTLIC